MATISKEIPLELIEKVKRKLLAGKNLKRLVFIGMPGSGKSTIGKALAELLDFEFFDSDQFFLLEKGERPASYIETYGKDEFRKHENKCLNHLVTLSDKKLNGIIILSTGGGVVTREENFGLIKNSSVVIYLRRPLEFLDWQDRPRSIKKDMYKLYEERRAKYESWSDIEIWNTDRIDITVFKILEHLINL